jgi:heme a synthase
MSYAAASPDRRLPLLRRLAWLCTVLMLATISLSAFMRLSQAGLGCADWPACYGQNLRDTQQGVQAASGHAVAAARLAHRVVASLTLVLVIVLTMATLATRPVLRRAGALSLALLLLALALAVLGIATPGARLPAVAMGNLLGGYVMLALCWRLVASARPPSDATAARLGTWAVAGLVLLCGQLAGGALVSASYAALSCSELAECTRAAAAVGWDWSVLNPWREPVVGGTALPVNAGSAFALWLHRIGAIVVLPVLALLGLAAWRRGRRRGGAALLVLAAVQGALGLLIVANGLPLAAVLLHNLVAALLLATLVRLV